MKKGCMSWYFQVNNQRQKTSEDNAAMCSFVMFNSSLVISYMRWQLKIFLTNSVQALEFRNEEERQSHEQENMRLNEEIKDLIANGHVGRSRCFGIMLCFIKRNSGEVHL